MAEADIHIRNHYKPGGFVEDEDNQIVLEFSVPARSFYEGTLFRYNSNTAFATFLSDTLNEGDHAIAISDTLLSNGIFAYVIQNELSQGFSGLMVINKPDTALPGTVPFAQTNEEGEFILNAFQLAFGDGFTSGENGNKFEITDSLEIIITTDDNVVTVEKVKVKPNTENFFEISVN